MPTKNGDWLLNNNNNMMATSLIVDNENNKISSINKSQSAFNLNLNFTSNRK